MSIKANLHDNLNHPNLSVSERAIVCCEIAKGLEDNGSYEAAREALGELWVDVGSRPKLRGLDLPAKAEVLLRVGSLTGWLGRLRQIKGAQEIAKDLLTESISIFESLKQKPKVFEAQIEIAWCYWREGAFDEARVLLEESRAFLGDLDDDLKIVALLRSGINEFSLGRIEESISLFRQAESLVEASLNASLKGRFYNSYALALRHFATTQENQTEYLDKSLTYYSLASRYLEEVGNKQVQAMVENNIGIALRELKRYQEAEVHYNTAVKLFLELSDEGYLAQAYESIARLLIETGRYYEAESRMREAISILEKGGPQAPLIEARTTYGIALARQGKYPQAWDSLEQAIAMGELLGDREGAGRAGLSVIEELRTKLSPFVLSEFLDRAKSFLNKSQNGDSISRLRVCESLISSLRNHEASIDSVKDLDSSGVAALSESIEKLSDVIGQLSEKINNQNHVQNIQEQSNDTIISSTNNRQDRDYSDLTFLTLPHEVRVYFKKDTIKSYIGRVTAILIKEVRAKLKGRQAAANSLGIAASTMDQRLRYAQKAASASNPQK